MSVTVGDQTVRRVSMKRTHPDDGHVAREKKRIPVKGIVVCVLLVSFAGLPLGGMR